MSLKPLQIAISADMKSRGTESLVSRNVLFSFSLTIMQITGCCRAIEKYRPWSYLARANSLCDIGFVGPHR